jgi:hypothetical protein
MNLTDITDDMLFRAINESYDIEWSFLALKVMILRLRLKLTMTNYSESAKKQCCEEMRTLLTKSIRIPSARKDIELIKYHFK